MGITGMATATAMVASTAAVSMVGATAAVSTVGAMTEGTADTRTQLGVAASMIPPAETRRTMRSACWVEFALSLDGCAVASTLFPPRTDGPVRM
mmetsp:Transcript_101570/g.285326  ORF Transcript_101570/g.285326 Transcript_101570/m.285326 type:complete len:94 (+) Transcript_101570:2054-2335(+)